MSLPAKIYKYQPPTIQAISNLSRGSIWFADPMDFNDPFDCALQFDLAEIKQEVDSLSDADALELVCNTVSDESKAAACQLRGSQLRNAAWKGLETAIEKHSSRNRGVSCFSETNRDLLMWGHYADRHRGYCLEFTTGLEPFNDPAKLRKVAYTKTFPSFNLRRLRQGEVGHLLDLLFTKADCWSYEKEWRLLHNESKKLYDCARDCLTGIYFGAMVDTDVKTMICAMLSRTKTKFYEMTIGRNGFELSSNQVPFFPVDYTGDEPIVIR